VPEPIAHFLEIVDVEVRQREGMAVAPRTLELATGVLIERAAVLDMGQIVGAGERALSAIHPVVQ